MSQFPQAKGYADNGDSNRAIKKFSSAFKILFGTILVTSILIIAVVGVTILVIPLVLFGSSGNDDEDCGCN